MKQRVRFAAHGETIVGDLYLPAGAGPHAAVAVAGPMTSVKEQVTGVYACALAVRGFAALCIDHRHYGESGGSPRQLEHAEHKIEDLVAATRWLAEQPAIDPERLGLVGVCLGAGYAAWASVREPRVKALAAVAGYFRDVEEMRAKDAAGFDAKVDMGRAARRHYEETGVCETIPAAAMTGDAAMSLADTFDYYATPRAAVPGYVNGFAVMSREYFLPFDVQAAAPRLAVPFAMVHADQALSPPWARRFFEAVRTPKTLHWMTSRNQVDFYDRPELVQPAADHVAAHLRTHLPG